MAKIYKVPGVYIEEVNKFPSTIVPVETAIPAFMGRTEYAIDIMGKDIFPVSGKLPIPTRITSFQEYQKHFGGANTENDIFSNTGMPNIIDTLVENKLTNRVITCTPKSDLLSGAYLYYAIQMFYANGGGPCYIVSSGNYNSAFNNEAGQSCLDAIAKMDEPTILIFTDKHADCGTISGYKELYDQALVQCNNFRDRIAIFDPWILSDKPSDDLALFRSDIGMQHLKYGCVYYPWLKSTLSYHIDESLVKVKHSVGVENGILDSKSLTDIKTIDLDAYLVIKEEINKITINLPPSSTVAGIMNRVDNNRGVWKASANEQINLVFGPTFRLTDAQQQIFNIDPTTGKSVNAIIFATGKRTLIWGARTLLGNDNEWRYISIVRFFNFVEESLKKGTEFVVFEPNDANTWIKIKSMCENFLNQLWRQGALQGIKPNNAFYVRVGLGSTMTSLDILEGRIKIEIGMAVVRPAEFVILKISHKMQES
ncbi:phage tail sheath family protein [Pedobacter mucosus]|uniref:phage tail sheath family protein n=1 Tax=Pedobacter mucosus TaxID=2895286 RepID=UPI001EE4623C|nr:phage tail sheath C-terminal domain-containing protein [Pedobacter mucosus]UKT65627.1 phage tail sheath family protein [Pedobacter mucosus]